MIGSGSARRKSINCTATASSDGRLAVDATHVRAQRTRGQPRVVEAAAKAACECFPFICRFEGDVQADAAPIIMRGEARRFEPALVEPDPHRRHLLEKFATLQNNFDCQHVLSLRLRFAAIIPAAGQGKGQQLECSRFCHMRSRHRPLWVNDFIIGAG
jgi:hypothetical protein